MVLLLVLCNLVLTASTLAVSTQSMTLMLGGQTCLVKLTPTRQVISRSECPMYCLLTPDCSSLFYADNKLCSLPKVSGDCCVNAVNMTTEYRIEDAEIWMEQNKLNAQKSQITSAVKFTTFRNSSTGPNGQIQTLVVGTTGCRHNITAKGASGRQRYNDYDGCLGAVSGSSFMLNARDEWRVVVGQEGGHSRHGAQLHTLV